MKVDIKGLVINEAGEVEITIDDIEDFWTLANLIQVGDRLRSQVRRKIVKVSQTGKTDSRQILAVATVQVVELDFQAGVNEMHVRGVLTHDLEDAREGSSQRILLEIGRPFKLFKTCWDKFSYDEILDAANPASNANVSAIIMQSGISHICIIGKNTTVVKEKISKNISKVRTHGGSGKNMEDKLKFFHATAESFIRCVNVEEMKCIIIASPGFLQHEFLTYLNDNQSKYKLQSTFSANKFIESTVSSGYPQELDTLLSQPQMQIYVSELRAANQSKAYEQLMKEMSKSVDFVLFGNQKVLKAAEENAIKTLLITDLFIRSLPLFERRKFYELKERIEKENTEVIIFSTRHNSGDQLSKLGGIAAILRYAIPQENNNDFDEDFK